MAGAGDDNMNGQKLVRRTLTNLPAQAINCDGGDRAARSVLEGRGEMVKLGRGGGGGRVEGGFGGTTGRRVAGPSGW